MKSHRLEWLFQNNGLIYLNNRQGSCGENLKVQLLESPLKVQNDPNTFWSIRGGSSELSSFHRMYPKNGPEWPDFSDHLWWESCIQFAFSVDNLVFMNYTLLPIGLIVLTCFFSERIVNYWKWIFWKTINIRIIRISEIANCRTWTIDHTLGIATKKGPRGDKYPMGNN